MSESIKSGSSNAVRSDRLSSGVKVADRKPKESEKAVENVVSEVNKTKDSIERLTEAATSRIEVIKQNESSARIKVEDVDEALRLSKDLKINIESKPEEAKSAHSIRTLAAKELLK
jgi:hypothetical protein